MASSSNAPALDALFEPRPAAAVHMEIDWNVAPGRVAEEN